MNARLLELFSNWRQSKLGFAAENAKQVQNIRRLLRKESKIEKDETLSKLYKHYSDLLHSYMGNKTIWITGGISGIGEATMVACVERGCDVISVGSRQNQKNEDLWVQTELWLKSLASSSEPPYPPFGRYAWIPMDVSDENQWMNDDWRTAMKSFYEESPTSVCAPYGVFINAGTRGPTETVEQLTIEDFRTVFRTNVLGVSLTLKYGLKIMRQCGQFGTFILCSSPAAKEGRPAHTLYGTTKAAAENLMRTEAVRWGNEPKHPGFIIIRPSGVCTDLAIQAANETANGGKQPKINRDYIGQIVAEMFAGKINRRQRIYKDVDVDEEILLKAKND